MWRYKNQGYILLIVLIFLQIVSCMGIYALFSTARHVRINRDRWLKVQYQASANKLLHSLEESLLKGSHSCLIPRISANEIVEKPSSWWHLHTCDQMVGKFHYYYFFELIGENNASYRITVRADVSNMNLILQSTLVSCSKKRVRELLR